MQYNLVPGEGLRGQDVVQMQPTVLREMFTITTDILNWLGVCVHRLVQFSNSVLYIRTFDEVEAHCYCSNYQ